jgi:DNA polymerase-1
MSNLGFLPNEYTIPRNKPAKKPSNLKPAESNDNPCEKCTIGGRLVMPKGCSVKNPVMIIGAYPGVKEDKDGTAFVGDSGDFLHLVELEAGFTLDEIYETNILKCLRPLGDDGKVREITDKELKNCGWFVLKEIQELRPSLIVLCGELPLKYFFNQKYVTQVRGQIKVKGDYKFLITFNPAHIIREEVDSIDHKAFRRDIKSAYEIYKGINRTSDRDYRLVSSLEELDKVIEELKSSEAISVDLETYAPGKWEDKRALDPWTEGFKIISVSLANKPNAAWCILLEHPENTLDLETVKARLEPLIEGNTPKVGQSIKFDYRCLAVHWDWHINNIVFDTEIGSSLLDERKGIHNLDRLALDWLGERSYKYEAGKIGTYIPKAKDLVIRNCTDADYTLRIYHLMKKRLIEENVYNFFMEEKMPTIPALGRVEVRGIPMDKEYVSGLCKTYEDRISELKGKIESYPEVKAIPDFNIDSNQHLQVLFFDKLKFETLRETKTGFSTDKDVVDALAKKYHHPILEMIKEYKNTEKFRGTYLAPLIFSMPKNPTSPHIKYDGRVHPTFNQHIAASGRLSATNPNVQNVPARIKNAKEIMDCYGNWPGWKIGLGDYSQMELRILAQYSQDPVMLEAFRNDEDLHDKTAAECTKVSGNEVSRDDAKGLNFGIVYGETEFGLAEALGVSRKIAKLYLDTYLKVYAGVKEYQKEMKSNLRQFGYVTTMFGRKRWIKLYGNGDEGNKKNAEAYRKAINTPIQGTATDINTKAFRTLVDTYVQEGYRSFPISLIHDAIMFEIADDEDYLKDLNLCIMENLDLPWLTDVKLKVDWSEGKTWGDAKFKEKKQTKNGLIK